MTRYYWCRKCKAGVDPEISTGLRCSTPLSTGQVNYLIEGEARKCPMPATHDFVHAGNICQASVAVNYACRQRATGKLPHRERTWAS